MSLLGRRDDGLLSRFNAILDLTQAHGSLGQLRTSEGRGLIGRLLDFMKKSTASPQKFSFLSEVSHGSGINNGGDGAGRGR